MFDGDDRDLFIDAIDDAEIATSGAMQTFEPEAERLANPVRILGKRPVAELDDRSCHLRRQPLQGSARGGRPRDSEGHRGSAAQCQRLVLAQHLGRFAVEFGQTVADLRE